VRARVPAGDGRLRELAVPRLAAHGDDRQRHQRRLQRRRLLAARRRDLGDLHARDRRLHGFLPALGRAGLAGERAVTVVDHAASPPAAELPRKRRKAVAFDRPRFLWVLYGAIFLYLFVPIGIVVAYSFSSSKSLQVYGTFSLRWYREFWDDATLKHSLLASLEVAAATMAIATVLGTMLAFGLVRVRGRISKPANVLM